MLYVLQISIIRNMIFCDSVLFEMNEGRLDC